MGNKKVQNKKQKKPLISVITVCYNEEKDIEKTCKSISEQTFDNFEWVVVDGKSTDNTLNILKKYKKNIDVLHLIEKKGIYDAQNKGIALTRGEYILFINGGDCLRNKEVLKKVSEFIMNDKKLSDIYYGDIELDNGEIASYKKAKLDKKHFITNTIPHPSSFIKKDLFDKYGGYDEKYKIVADYDFWLKMILVNNAKTKYLPVIVSIFNQGGVSTNSNYIIVHVKERTSALKSYDLITNSQAKIQELKWLFYKILKKMKLYFIIRKVYRKVKAR